MDTLNYTRDADISLPFLPRTKTTARNSLIFSFTHYAKLYRLAAHIYAAYVSLH